MSKGYHLASMDGAQVIPLMGAMGGSHYIAVVFDEYPAAGTVAIDYQRVGQTTWTRLQRADGLPMTDMVVARAEGPVKALRITFDGLSGGSGAMLWIDSTAVPANLFMGNHAMNVQFYDESNKKRGVQWEAARFVTLADNTPASNVYSVIRTGALPVDLKSRVFGWNGLGVEGRIYKNPVFTGGVVDPVFNMNTEFSGTQPLTQLISAPNWSSKGTEVGAVIGGIGPASQQGRGATPQTLGSNRILEPDTDYLLEIVSRDPQSQIVYARIEFYEGLLDLPL